MPNTKTAKKRWRQSLERRESNRSTKAELRSRTRKIREGIAAGKITESEAAFRVLTKKLDKAAAHNVVHANLSARVKSRLSTAIKNAKGKKK